MDIIQLLHFCLPFKQQTKMQITNSTDNTLLSSASTLQITSMWLLQAKINYDTSFYSTVKEPFEQPSIPNVKPIMNRFQDTNKSSLKWGIMKSKI